MALHEHRAHNVFLRNLILRQDRGIEPARERDSRRFHDLLVVETAEQIVVVNLPDARPVLPGPFGQAVVERQRHDIETDVRGALHVVMATENIGTGAGSSDVTREQQQYAACSHVGGADGVLGLTHAPDQRRRLLRREHLGDPFELCARNTRHPLDLFRIPFLHFLARIFKAVDALPDELLVFPAILDDVPHDPVQHGDVCAGAQAHIFRRVRGRARQSRINHHDVRLVDLGALDQMLQ